MNNHHTPRFALLASSITLALALSACGGGGGGGGGNVKPEAPPPAPPAPPPPSLCEDDSATNTGGELPCTYRYNGRGDNVLVPVNADLAHEAGFTGKGAKVGVFDDSLIEGYEPLDGRVEWYRDFTGKADEPDPSEKHGHGAMVAAVLGGKAMGDFKGGVAPDAELHWARICYDNSCYSNNANAAIQDMAKNGVRLFNFSLGGSYSGDESTSAIHGWARGLRPAVEADGIIINSAGNESEDQPNNISHVPRLHPEFNGHVLTVAAIDVDADGNPDGLADYSNACGLAAEWCVVAPGLADAPAVPGSAYQNGGQGTSFAAPIVTGTAALVDQAFPWMSARNIQQTVLTTATDLGEAGVDPIYGWGLVNAEKAVRGPAMFTGGDFHANVTSGSYEFSNDIAGDSGLHKQGKGRLALTGENTYSGETVVEEGHLIVHNGTPGAAQVLGGTLTIGGKVGGDFIAGENGTTEIALGGQVDVAGDAMLDGTLRLLNPASGYEVGAVETLLTAKAVEGEFAEVAFGSGFFWSAELDYTATEVVANLERASAQGAAMAAGSGQRVIEGARQADALFAFLDAAGSGQHEAVAAAAARLANAQTQADAEIALASLTGEVHGTARAAAISQAMSDSLQFGDRIATLSQDDAGVWVQGTSFDAEFDRDGFATADVRQTGLTVGVDRGVGTTGVVGLALSTGRGWGDLDALGGRYDSDNDALTAYGRMDLPTGYLAASATFGRNKVDTRRAVLLDGEAAHITGNHEDDTVAARLEVGVPFGSFTPFVAGGHVRHKQGGFTENGADGLGLMAGGNTASIHYGEAGVRFFHQYNRLGLFGTLAGRWTGGDTRPTYAASFAGAPGATVEIHGQRVPGNAYRGAVGLEYTQARNVTWNISVGGETGAGDSSNAYVTGGLRIAF